MSKHTPGPWKVEFFDEEFEIVGPNHSYDNNLEYIAVAINGLKSVEANARLIAKAPEMYALLRSLADAKKIDDPSYALMHYDEVAIKADALIKALEADE